MHTRSKHKWTPFQCAGIEYGFAWHFGWACCWVVRAACLSRVLWSFSICTKAIGRRNKPNNSLLSTSMVDWPSENMAALDLNFIVFLFEVRFSDYNDNIDRTRIEHSINTMTRTQLRTCAQVRVYNYFGLRRRSRVKKESLRAVLRLALIFINKQWRDLSSYVHLPPYTIAIACRVAFRSGASIAPQHLASLFHRIRWIMEKVL